MQYATPLKCRGCGGSTFETESSLHSETVLVDGRYLVPEQSLPC